MPRPRRWHWQGTAGSAHPGAPRRWQTLPGGAERSHLWGAEPGDAGRGSGLAGRARTGSSLRTLSLTKSERRAQLAAARGLAAERGGRGGAGVSLTHSLGGGATGTGTPWGPAALPARWATAPGEGTGRTPGAGPSTGETEARGELETSHETLQLTQLMMREEVEAAVEPLPEAGEVRQCRGGARRTRGCGFPAPSAPLPSPPDSRQSLRKPSGITGRSAAGAAPSAANHVKPISSPSPPARRSAAAPRFGARCSGSGTPSLGGDYGGRRRVEAPRGARAGATRSREQRGGGKLAGTGARLAR